MQDRIIAEARANASDSRGRADAAEKTLYLHQARELGFWLIPLLLDLADKALLLITRIRMSRSFGML